jgi:hypothetical protein
MVISHIYSICWHMKSAFYERQHPSNPKSSFYCKRDVRKETPMPRVEAFICMFCGRAGHLDEFCFQCKRIEKQRFEYARNS